MGGPTAKRSGLLEREAELEQIAALLAGARAGHGRTMVISGEAGVGKTSLLDVARAEATRGAELAVLSARATELELDFPFGVARQLFEPALTGLDAAERARLLEGPARPAAPLVTGAAPRPGGVPTDALFTAVHALYWLVSRLAEERPLLLVIDDAHWSDVESLRFFGYLAGRLEALPLLAVIASRSAEPGAQRTLVEAIARERTSETLTPATLSEAATGELLARQFANRADPSFLAACHRASGGNPFLIRELITTLAADSVEPSAANAERVAELGPATVARAVLARLAKLPSSCTALARALAVLGPGAELGETARLAGLDDAEAAADELERAEIVRPTRPMEFIHPILGSAIYADMSAVQRSAAHAQTAVLLHERGAAVERITAHLVASDPGHGDWATDVLLAAGRDALDRGAPKTATSALRRALAEGPEGTRRADALELLGLAVTTAGDPSGARYLEEAVGLMDDLGRRLAARVVLARALFANGELPDAVRVYERAREDAGASMPESMWTFDAAIALAGLFDVRTQERGIAELRKLIERPEIADTPIGRFTLADSAFEGWRRGSSHLEIGRRLERVLAHDPTDDPTDLHAFVDAAWNVGVFGSPDRAERILSDVLSSAHRSGYVMGAAHAYSGRALIRLLSDNVDGALMDARYAVEGIDYGWRNIAPACIAFLTEALIEQGDTAAAGEAMDASRLPGGEERWHTNVMYPFLIEARGHHALNVGDLNRAQAVFLEAREWLRRADLQTAPYAVTPCLSGAALATAGLGQRAEARRLLAEEMELVGPDGPPRARGRALRVSGLIEEGERSIALFHEAIELLGPSQARLEHAYALVDLGAALRRQGKRRAAREPLSEGLVLARRCGATALAERAHSELRAAGARPRKIVRAGVEALTPAELRVCRMAAEGLTNKAIAQTLFVTVRTVETHLNHAFQKLDVHSRRDLPAALTGDGSSGSVDM